MYSLFLLFTPWVIKQFDLNRWRWIIMFSGVIWLTDQFGARQKLLNVLFDSPDTHLGFFSSFAWQILFVSGLLCGHKAKTAKMPWLPRGWRLPMFAYGIALLLFAIRHDLLGIEPNQKWIQRSSLGPLRLLDFGCLVFLVARFRGSIEKWMAWKGLAFLSRHSLQVFAFHLIPVYAASLCIAGRTSLSWWMQALFIAFCIAGLFQIAWIAQIIKTWPLKPRSDTIPLPLVSPRSE